MKISEVVRLLSGLPGAKNAAVDAQKMYTGIIGILEEHRLIYIENDCEDEDEEYEPEYGLTDAGRKLTGYVVSIDEFDEMMRSICESVSEKEAYDVDLLWKILDAKEMEGQIRKHISPLTDNYPQTIKNAVEEMRDLSEKAKSRMSKQVYSWIRKNLSEYKSLIQKKRYGKLSADKTFQKLRILFALLMWEEAQYTTKRLYDSFGISYMQMKRFVERISYRLDIIRLALPVAGVESGQSLYQKLGSERVHEVEDWLKDLSEGLFYRVPAYICRFLDIQCSDPRQALEMREVAKTYEFLAGLEGLEDEKLKKKDINRIRTEKDRMAEWKPEWRDAFRTRFEGILQYGD